MEENLEYKREFKSINGKLICIEHTNLDTKEVLEILSYFDDNNYKEFRDHTYSKAQIYYILVQYSLLKTNDNDWHLTFYPIRENIAKFRRGINIDKLIK